MSRVKPLWNSPSKVTLPKKNSLEPISNNLLSFRTHFFVFDSRKNNGFLFCLFDWFSFTDIFVWIVTQNAMPFVIFHWTHFHRFIFFTSTFSLSFFVLLSSQISSSNSLSVFFLPSGSQFSNFTFVLRYNDKHEEETYFWNVLSSVYQHATLYEPQSHYFKDSCRNKFFPDWSNQSIFTINQRSEEWKWWIHLQFEWTTSSYWTFCLRRSLPFIIQHLNSIWNWVSSQIKTNDFKFLFFRAL